MEAKKQLAQRLFFTPGTSTGGLTKSFASRSESTDHKKAMISTLAPKIGQPMKSKKPVQLDPISPHLRNKVSPIIKDDFTIKTESFSQSKEPVKVPSTKPGQQREKDRKSHIHGDLEYPVSVPSSANKVTSPFTILHMIKYDPDLAEDFWYLNRKEDPYDFEFVTYQKRNPKQYLTISSRGVTYYTVSTIFIKDLKKSTFSISTKSGKTSRCGRI